MQLLHLMMVTVSVPEPATLLLLATGIGGIALVGRGRKKDD